MSRKLFIALALTLLAAFFLAAYPVYVIRPFRYQGPRELALALTVVRFRPVLEAVLAIIALAAMAFAWTKLLGRYMDQDELFAARRSRVCVRSLVAYQYLRTECSTRWNALSFFRSTG